MDNIRLQQEREKLDELLASKGYMENKGEPMAYGGNSSGYKIFTTNTDNPYQSGSGNSYATANFDTKGELNCPECDGKPMYSCPCDFKDSMCAKGHIFYVDSNGILVAKDPHKEELK